MTHAPESPGHVPGSISPEDQAQIQDLQAQISDLAAQLVECEKQTRAMMAREAAGDGVHASEIHRLKQLKMVLLTEIQHRKVRINALRFGF
jgi:hypothetical protein